MKRLCLVVLCVLLGGCATLFSSGPESINVKSDPPGARFQYGLFTGTTPTTILVPRKALAKYATFRMDGYEEKTVPVMTGFQGVALWGLLFWPFFFIDCLTGSAYNLDPPEINTSLDIVKNTKR